MTITRSEIVKMLSQKTGYFQKAIDPLLKAYDELLLEYMNEVTDDEEVIIQAFKGIRIGCKIVKPRERINPKTQQRIICQETVKPFVKWSKDFRIDIQEQYDNKQLEDSE